MCPIFKNIPSVSYIAKRVHMRTQHIEPDHPDYRVSIYNTDNNATQVSEDNPVKSLLTCLIQQGLNNFLLNNLREAVTAALHDESARIRVTIFGMAAMPFLVMVLCSSFRAIYLGFCQ